MPKHNVEISQMDRDHYLVLRSEVDRFVEACAARFDAEGVRVLDVAPQVHKGAAPFFIRSRIETFDIDPNSGCTYIGDITKPNPEIPDGSYDVVVCTEVLEHTLQPFNAADEIFRILRKGGVALVTTPFNFRLHGPFPDCWRFTEFGLQALFSKFTSVEITETDTPGRELMPIHYQTIATK